MRTEKRKQKKRRVSRSLESALRRALLTKSTLLYVEGGIIGEARYDERDFRLTRNHGRENCGGLGNAKG